MKPCAIWVAIVLLVVGVCGILDAASVLDWNRTVGQWWPLVIIGWAIADMVPVRRLTLGGTIWVAIGLTLLADVQEWAGDAFVWSSLALFIGVALLAGAFLSRGDRAGRNGGRTPVGGGAC